MSNLAKVERSTMNPLPRKISPCPIKEVIFEMRFESELPPDAIFGVLYSRFRNEYEKVEQLPILQLPQVVRAQDPNLVHAPHYRLTNEDSIIQIGPKVFSLANVGDYIGWEKFSEQIQRTYESVKETNVVSSLTRVALRYINIFEDINILTGTNFRAYLGDEALSSEKINFSAEIPSDKSISQLKIINSAEAVISGRQIKGSIIDIDSAVDPQDFASFAAAVEYSHTEEKVLFYKVLGERFITTLSPEY